MPQIDRLLSLLVQSRAAAVELVDGEPAAFVTGADRRAATRQPLAAAQILAFVREIAPPGVADSLGPLQPGEFAYSSADGHFAVRLSRFGDRWGATLTPLPEPPSQSPPSASSPPSPSSPPSGSSPHVPSTSPSSTPLSAALSAALSPGSPLAHAERLLRTLVERRGSDLHLRVGEPPVIRASGELERLDDAPLTESALEALLVALMPERNRAEYADCGDTDFAYEIAGVARFRANALRDRRGPAGVFRVIPATVVSVEEMGLSPEVQQLCFLTKGLVLVTGPTGSGKSTTLCAMVDLVNRSRADHILTIEDPIEFVHPSKRCLVTQRQVGVHTGSFKSALRAALREDPDVILVGELRDLETVAIAIETAETGHLVFGTLHTTTAAGTVDRIIDQFPADRQAQIRTMLSESLKGVISQTLCKKVGGGRAAAREVLLATPAVSNLVREGKTFQIPSIMQTSKKLGMVTLNDALLEHVDAGRVEPREAWTKAVDKPALVQALRTRGHDTSFAEAK